jgi:riboflavin synthase alpha subunit
MFTGIIEEVGKVAKIEQRGENRRITVEAANTPKELRTGNSVAVSGVCLTALDIKPKSFCADLAPETWVRTSFSRMHEGALVNLELPMKADGRFGGHIVQGHVDGVGKLIEFERILDRTAGTPKTGGCTSKFQRRSRSTRCTRDRSQLKASASPSPNWNAIAARSPSFPIR